MTADPIKVTAAVSLVAMMSVSLTLFARSHGSSEPTAAQPASSEADALPEDHPEMGPATLFEARFNALSQGLVDAPDDSDAILEMAGLLQDAHQPNEAAYYYERFLKIHPDSGSAWLYLANAYGEASKWQESADATSRMLARLPGHAGGLYNMGAALANQGNYAGARRWWNDAVEAGDPAVAGQAADALSRLPES